MAKLSTDLIVPGIRHEPLKSHSGLDLDWWWDLDKLSYKAQDSLASYMDEVSRGCTVGGIARGGTTLALMSDSEALLSIEPGGAIEIIRALCHWECILWDDVVTTGQSMIDAEEALKKHGIVVVQRVCVLDRREEFHRPVDCPVCKTDAPDLQVTSLFTTADLVAAGLVPEKVTE